MLLGPFLTYPSPLGTLQISRPPTCTCSAYTSCLLERRPWCSLALLPRGGRAASFRASTPSAAGPPPPPRWGRRPPSCAASTAAPAAAWAVPTRCTWGCPVGVGCAV